MRSLPLLACLCLIATLAAGCRRDTAPSPEYARASKLWLATVNELGDDAGSDPRAEEALALARSVPADSIDSEAARALVKRIEEAQADAAPDEAADEEDEEWVEVSPSEEASPEPPPAPVARPPLVGSSEADFKGRYGACVVIDSPFVEAGGTRVGDAWRLVASAACQEAHPEIGDLLVFILEGKVFNVAPRSALKTVVRTDAGWQPDEALPAEGTPAEGQ